MATLYVWSQEEATLMQEEQSFEIAGIYPLRADELDRLAIFNSELARGLLHTPEYEARMADLQSRFDKAATFNLPSKREES